MKLLVAVIVCAAVLYEIDAHMFSGFYFATVNRGLSDVYRQW